MSSVTPVAVPERIPLSTEQRRLQLQRSINNFCANGYRVISQTETTAQLLKPKRFSCLIAGLTIWILGIGLLLYIIIFLAMKDSTAYLQVDDFGTVWVNGKPYTG